MLVEDTSLKLNFKLIPLLWESFSFEEKLGSSCMKNELDEEHFFMKFVED